MLCVDILSDLKSFETKYNHPNLPPFYHQHSIQGWQLNTSNYFNLLFSKILFLSE